MKEQNLRNEVMNTIEQSMGSLLEQYLRPVEQCWQPADFLPDPASDSFYEELKELQELSQSMSYDLLVTLIGDTITEEALPNYETWLMSIDGVVPHEGWSQWVRSWTAEENRHGDLLNRYLYLCGRVDMKQMEITTQYLINDGLDTQAGTDPYSSFVFTSFQEIATNISHRNVASQVKKLGDDRLSKICGIIAADEARHANAYKKFVSLILEMDPNGLLLAFEAMMRKKVIMPAHNMREEGGALDGSLFTDFSNSAQRCNVYTTQDYIQILETLLNDWEINKPSSLSSEANRAQDFLMALPARLTKISMRMTIPEERYKFKWIA